MYDCWCKDENFEEHKKEIKQISLEFFKFLHWKQSAFFNVRLWTFWSLGICDFWIGPVHAKSEISENENPVGSSRLTKKCSRKSKDKGLKIEKRSEGPVPENNNNRSPEVISSDSDS